MNDNVLILSLLFPRICLVYLYGNGLIPANTLPLWADIAMALFIPRILWMIYIYQNFGVHSGWFIAHAVVVGILVMGGIIKKTR